MTVSQAEQRVLFSNSHIGHLITRTSSPLFQWVSLAAGLAADNMVADLLAGSKDYSLISLHNVNKISIGMACVIAASKDCVRPVIGHGPVYKLIGMHEKLSITVFCQIMIISFCQRILK